MTLLDRLKTSLSKTRARFTSGLARLFLGKKEIDPHWQEAIQTLLLTADLGPKTTEYLLGRLAETVARENLKDSDLLFSALKKELTLILEPCARPLIVDDFPKPAVILVVGVNGSGKTTTIGKLAYSLQAAGKKVLLAAGDTFRAAAIPQLQSWGNRHNISVIAQSPGADSAAVIYDALQASRARGLDVLIADTAGRLHTQSHLMEELKKIKRVLAKCDPSLPHETMLVLDATTGQNALRQVEEFHKAIPITSLAITKLDGTAKGGILFALANQYHLPVRFIGIGEGREDLKPFDATLFIEALFNP
ncbi:MAG: signal recognition particle-docking protein FtsY [Gammaproteobacteria bacterium]|nr:signal recognition particle-docking protein FtsY [Gammaproteobacteria bacterium]